MPRWLPMAMEGFYPGVAPFTTRGICPGLLALALIFLAASLLKWLRVRSDLDTLDWPQTSLFVACLGTAGAALVGLWAIEMLQVDYFQFVVLILALASCVAGLFAVVNVWFVAPALFQPSRQELQSRLRAGEKAIDQLRVASDRLQEQVIDSSREVDDIKRRFEVALRGSTITVFSQDCELRYVWVHNPPSGVSAECLIGGTDFDAYEHDVAERMVSFKRRVLDRRAADRLELTILDRGQPRNFDIVAEPYVVAGVVKGLLCVSVEMTDRKRREVQLRNALREVSHRSKNMLAVLLGVARQTALDSTSVEVFMSAFRARLLSMSITQDLLIESGWEGVDLEGLIRGQAAPYLAETQVPFTAIGPALQVMPEPAQNLGLAIHELVRHAALYGALKQGGERIEVVWCFVLESDGILKLNWVDHGHLAARTFDRRSFARIMLGDILPRALDGQSQFEIVGSCLEVVMTINASLLVCRGEPRSNRGVVRPTKPSQPSQGVPVP